MRRNTWNFGGGYYLGPNVRDIEMPIPMPKFGAIEVDKEVWDEMKPAPLRDGCEDYAWELGYVLSRLNYPGSPAAALTRAISLIDETREKLSFWSHGWDKLTSARKYLFEQRVQEESCGTK